MDMLILTIIATFMSVLRGMLPDDKCGSFQPIMNTFYIILLWFLLGQQVQAVSCWIILILAASQTRVEMFASWYIACGVHARRRALAAHARAFYCLLFTLGITPAVLYAY